MKPSDTLTRPLRSEAQARADHVARLRYWINIYRRTLKPLGEFTYVAENFSTTLEDALQDIENNAAPWQYDFTIHGHDGIAEIINLSDAIEKHRWAQEREERAQRAAVPSWA